MAFRHAAFGWLVAVWLVAPTLTWAGDDVAPGDRSGSRASTLAELVEELRRELVGVRAEVHHLRGEVEALKAGRNPVVEVADVTGGVIVDEPRDQVDVERVEEEQVLQQRMLETLYQTKVESGSRYRVRLSGMALFNAFATSAGGESFDVPELAEPPNPLHTGTSYGTTMRQSIVGLGVSGPTVAGARSSGELQFDFFGGFPESGNGVTTGLARLRTASMHLDWEDTSIVFGQTEPFVSPLSPSSLASVAIPALSYSGNLWAWVPQVSVERRHALEGRGILTLTGGLLDPLTGDEPVDLGNFQPGAGHRGGWPALAGRLGWRSGEAERSISLGVGGYYERQDWGPDRIVNGWATTADWVVPVADRFSLSGEFYSGRAFGGLGAGENGSVLFDGDPGQTTTSVQGLRSTGGWLQATIALTNRIDVNATVGQDAPSDADLRLFRLSPSSGESPVGRNRTGLLNVILRLRSNLLFSGEFRTIWTERPDGTERRARHVNLGVGVLF